MCGGLVSAQSSCLLSPQSSESTTLPVILSHQLMSLIFMSPFASGKYSSTFALLTQRTLLSAGVYLHLPPTPPLPLHHLPFSSCWPVSFFHPPHLMRVSAPTSHHHQCLGSTRIITGRKLCRTACVCFLCVYFSFFDHISLHLSISTAPPLSRW